MRIGVDEAGKGPVLGSMFAAAVAVPGPAILPGGVRDSKDLSAECREDLAAAIRADDRIRVGTASVPVARIDDPETDMNTLTVEAHAAALSEVATAGDAGFVDAGDVNADRFVRRVAERTDAGIDLDGEHGADASDPVVGAASIVAKVARDAHVGELAAEYGPVGSGYPSDATTRAFLRDYVSEHGDLPACTRRSWATARDVLSAAAQSALDEF